MKSFKEQDFVRGWFVGDFTPSCLNTDSCEVAVKRYEAGDKEPKHHHKIATEITFVVDGKISINGTHYEKGQIIMVEPGESVEFFAVEKSTNLVVKIPSVKGDKYED